MAFPQGIFGARADVDLIVSDTTIVPNTSTALVVDATEGDDTLRVASSAGFQGEDVAVLIQVQGASAGLLEYVGIASVSGNSVALMAPLNSSFRSGDGPDRAMLVRVPIYRDVTVMDGGTLSAPSWNGFAGGVLAFVATGIVRVEQGGVLEADARGFRGGNRPGGTRSCNQAGGQQGESFSGTGAIASPSNLGGGGGGSPDACAGCDQDSPGGGGGYGTAGADGVNPGGPSDAGRGGQSYGVEYLEARTFLGSGGGESHYVGNRGGNGGGAVIIVGDRIQIAGGSIRANGENGSQCGGGHPSGGGSGGSILLVTEQSADLGDGLVTATGGLGFGVCECEGETGGTGGAGRIRILSPAVTGTTTPAASVSPSAAPPVVSAPADAAVEELGTLSVTVTASDPDGNGIISLSADRSGLPGENDATFTTNATNTEGLLVWHPTAGDSGTYAVTFTAVDAESLSATATTSIHVIASGAQIVGELKWTPAPPDTGTFTVTFTAVDADSEATTASTEITVVGPSGGRALVARAPTSPMAPQRGPIISVTGSTVVTASEELSLTVSVYPDLTPGGQAGSLQKTVMGPTRGPIISLTANLTGLPGTNATFTTDFQPEVTAPASAEGQASSPVAFQVSAGDPDGDAILSFTADLSGLPAGALAEFTTNPGNTVGTFSWVPQSQDARDLPYPVVFTASNALVAEATTQITVRAGNGSPIADAGGPYSGFANVPVAFDGGGSSDPDGDALQYSWSFGDGLGGVGATPSHTYGSAGDYIAVLSVTDVRPQGSLADIDSASVRIQASLGARGFTTGGDRVIRLRSGKPIDCVELEPLSGMFQIDDIDLSSVRLRSRDTGFVAEIPSTPDSKKGKDSDRNGVIELSVCFRKEDLRLLFSRVSGRREVPVEVTGRLRSGATFVAPLTLDVIGASGALTAALGPNPFNPTAVLSFELPRGGSVRLQIFDLSGRLVREVIPGNYFAPGYHDIAIDGRDGNGRRLASGVYFYRLSAPGGNATGRIVLLE